jgi:uncharacterized protein
VARFRMALLIALCSVAIGALLPALPGVAQEAGDPDTVTVEARRTVDVEPDIGIVTLGVRASGSTAREATDELTDRTRSVINALKAAGFTDEEIDTTNVTLDRRCVQFCRNRNENDPDPVIGYVGSAGVRVETAALDRLGEVIDIGIDAGATGIRNVSFDVADNSEAVKEALRQAMLFAQDKAQTLAETGGRTLGRALIIVEGNSRPPERFVVGDAALAGYTSGSGSSGDNPFPIEPPTLSASARIEVTFELI